MYLGYQEIFFIDQVIGQEVVKTCFRTLCNAHVAINYKIRLQHYLLSMEYKIINVQLHYRAYGYALV